MGSDEGVQARIRNLEETWMATQKGYLKGVLRCQPLLQWRERSCERVIHCLDKTRGTPQGVHDRVKVCGCDRQEGFGDQRLSLATILSP